MYEKQTIFPLEEDLLLVREDLVRVQEQIILVQETHILHIQEGRVPLVQEGYLLLVQEGDRLLVQEGDLPLYKKNISSRATLLLVQDEHFLHIKNTCSSCMRRRSSFRTSPESWIQDTGSRICEVATKLLLV